ncbi:TadE/TadG family type IV pilus assembly protein [Sphingomonas fuzhouensis]|uniref:TadE/TadG family type IV pilus assembly protein n=1 Tax=Sphingomonas fuzhouensis TaxID=3106033 RepID=UPI002AFF93EE|nr:TadE/TadG family type IV pilus assembly protein [Sphingomonas sp. SGZ-02]
MIRHLTTLLPDTRGVALIEFALILPVMLFIYVGATQLQDGIGCNRKVTSTTRAAADLIAQNTTGVTTAKEVDESLSAAAMVLTPYAVDAAKIRVSEIAIDKHKNVTVVWSRGRNIRPYTPGTPITLPTAMQTANTFFLFAEVSYAYTPPVSFGGIGPLTLKDTIYMVPRNTDQIACPDCLL